MENESILPCISEVTGIEVMIFLKNINPLEDNNLEKALKKIEKQIEGMEKCPQLKVIFK